MLEWLVGCMAQVWGLNQAKFGPFGSIGAGGGGTDPGLTGPPWIRGSRAAQPPSETGSRLGWPGLDRFRIRGGSEDPVPVVDTVVQAGITGAVIGIWKNNVL